MPTNQILVLVGSVISVLWYQLYSLKNKVICQYTRPSNQQLKKFVRLDSKNVRFDNLEFTILPERHVLVWQRLLWGLFGNIGTWVIGYEFTWDSQYPRNPNSYKPSIVSPAAKKAMDNEASFIAYNRSVEKQSGRKGGLAQYFPFIIIGLVVLVAVYYLYGLIRTQGIQIQSLSDAIRLMNK